MASIHTVLRRSGLALCLACLTGASIPAMAQADAAGKYPERAIRMVVPFAAGGTSDVLARLIGEGLGSAIGQQVVVENRPGANGNIGTGSVANAAPDGYTLVLVADGTVAINPSLYPTLTFDPEKDFAPVSRVALVPLIVVANPQLKADTLQELVALSKQPSSDLYFSSAGRGSTGHLVGELIKNRSGLQMTHVPYKGGGQAVNDVVAGEVSVLVSALATVGPFIQAGKLKSIAVTSKDRVGSASAVPTVAESGIDGFDVSSWYGIMAPAGTPPAIIDKLNATLVQVLAKPELKERLETLGISPIGDSPQEFADALHADLARWADVVKSANISAQ